MKLVKWKLFTIRDAKVGVYRTVMYHVHVGDALRTFQEMANDPQCNIAKYPDDFSLYQVGEFDEDSGQIEPMAPKFYGTGSEFKAGANMGVNPVVKSVS